MGFVKQLHFHTQYPGTTKLAGRTHPPEHRNARALGSSAGMMGSNTWKHETHPRPSGEESLVMDSL